MFTLFSLEHVIFVRSANLREVENASCPKRSDPHWMLWGLFFDIFGLKSGSEITNMEIMTISYISRIAVDGQGKKAPTRAIMKRVTPIQRIPLSLPIEKTSIPKKNCRKKYVDTKPCGSVPL